MVVRVARSSKTEEQQAVPMSFKLLVLICLGCILQIGIERNVIRGIGTMKINSTPEEITRSSDNASATTAAPLAAQQDASRSGGSSTYWYNNHDGIDDRAANHTVNKDVMLMLTKGRHDRLGTNIQHPMYLMAFARCRNVRFCIEERVLGNKSSVTSNRDAMGYFPGFRNLTCTRDGYATINNPGFKNLEQLSLEPGVHTYIGDGPLMKWMEKDENRECAFDDAMRRKWGRMIVDATMSDNPWIQNKTLAREELFEKTNDPKVVTVAIHIRRGDFAYWGRKPIPDQSFVALLRRLRSILEKAGRTPEVHLFSEDYGMIDIQRNISCNWTMYNGLVEHWHLAPDMRNSRNQHAMNLDLNMRDWRHFIKADILVVGGTFSNLPSLGRPRHPDPETGLPLTFEQYAKFPNATGWNYGWTKYENNFWAPNKVSLVNLPEVFAKHDIIPTETFMKDLMADWNATYK